MQPIDTAGFLQGHHDQEAAARRPRPSHHRGRDDGRCRSVLARRRRRNIRGATAVRTSLTPATGNYEFEIGLPAGALLNAKVKKSRGSAGTPTFASLAGPQGVVDLGAINPTALKNIPIASTGLFTLAIAGGNGGEDRPAGQGQVPGRARRIHLRRGREHARHRDRRSAPPGSARRTPTSPPSRSRTGTTTARRSCRRTAPSATAGSATRISSACSRIRLRSRPRPRRART